jgi:hypothetical protein
MGADVCPAAWAAARSAWPSSAIRSRRSSISWSIRPRRSSATLARTLAVVVAAFDGLGRHGRHRPKRGW